MRGGDGSKKGRCPSTGRGCGSKIRKLSISLGCEISRGKNTRRSAQESAHVQTPTAANPGRTRLDRAAAAAHPRPTRASPLEPGTGRIRSSTAAGSSFCASPVRPWTGLRACQRPLPQMVRRLAPAPASGRTRRCAMSLRIGPSSRGHWRSSGLPASRSNRRAAPEVASAGYRQHDHQPDPHRAASADDDQFARDRSVRGHGQA